jgi:transposase
VYRIRREFGETSRNTYGRERMRPPGSQKVLEYRRRQAIRLWQEGEFTPKEIAAIVGTNRNTFYRWRRKYRQDGDAGIASTPLTGRPPRLSEDETTHVIGLLEDRPACHGYGKKRWTYQLVCELIEAKYGVKFCACHVNRILRDRHVLLSRINQRASAR